jgi:hypothetical protein
MTWQGNSIRTVNEVGSQMNHYAIGNLSAGYAEIHRLPPLPATANEGNVRGGWQGARFGRTVYCG